MHVSRRVPHVELLPIFLDGELERVVGRIAVFELIHFVAVVYRCDRHILSFVAKLWRNLSFVAQDTLKFRSGADGSGAENKALAGANFCFNWPNYLETDIYLLRSGTTATSPTERSSFPWLASLNSIIPIVAISYFAAGKKPLHVP
jgi:hypothetical protein